MSKKESDPSFSWQESSSDTGLVSTSAITKMLTEKHF